MRFWLNYLRVRHDWVLMALVASLLLGIELWPRGEEVRQSGGEIPHVGEEPDVRHGSPSSGTAMSIQGGTSGVNAFVTNLNSNGDQVMAHSAPVTIASDPTRILMANGGSSTLYVTIANSATNANGVTFMVPAGSINEFVPSAPLFGQSGYSLSNGTGSLHGGESSSTVIHLDATGTWAVDP